MLDVTKADYTYRNSQGDLVHLGGTHDEYEQYARGVSAGANGWVQIKYPCGHLAHVHFQAKEAGKPHFTNAHFDKTDIAVITAQLGEGAAKIFLANHI